MKKIITLSFVAVLLSSCSDSWDQENQDLFIQGCMESAKESGMKDDAAKSMCDCRLEKAMKKYPSFSDAMDHTNDLMNDPDMKACK